MLSWHPLFTFNPNLIRWSSALITRFAPSPTGALHLGHAHSALFGWRTARAASGRFLLRIEDIDPLRCRESFVDGIFEDLTWLGLDWDGPVWRQSDRMPVYATALERLRTLGVLYPCFCSRRDIQEEIARAGHAPHLAGAGPDGPPYPGTCRRQDPAAASDRVLSGEPHAVRLDVARAGELTGPLYWTDRTAGRMPARTDLLGDVVLARRDVPASYHLAVVVDDAAQGVTLVTRGDDLFHASPLHRLIQALLELPEPEWHHHRLLNNADGVRLSKRDGATTLQSLRRQGLSAAEARALAGFPDG
jgi:glutamyl-Q tRNA(Asp) synthetase